MTYNPPVQDMLFILHDVLKFEHADVDAATMEAVLEEAAKLASEVLAPLNVAGDEQGAVLKDGHVTTSPGFKEAYKQYCDGGWNAVPFPAEFGGQGLPWALAFPVQEMWQGANMAFGLCPLLNQGAVEAIISHGSKEQQEFYLPKLISGEWTGTMNLTEPHAGSDIGLVKSKAEKQGDGSYKISGQKIFITYGEHDYTDNIIHLVLARTTDAPPDVKGISLFIVPKFLEDGTRNEAVCIGLEHKLGIHGSPTCTMEFAGAKGFLIGKENEGLKYMFTMMNNARLSVGLQGVAIAERAYQHARNFAAERVQGKSFTTGQRVPIAEHADVKRMLMTMKSQIEAARALTYSAALAMDKEQQADVEVLTPIVKSWATDLAVEVASIGIQVFGGMGFIEETGAAQYYRDARILPIYEGTNGIQAADLAFRKVLRDGGEAAKNYMCAAKGDISDEALKDIYPYLGQLAETTEKLVAAGKDNKLDVVAGVSVPYLKAFAICACAVMMARSKAAAQGKGEEFYKDKIETADFYIANILPHAQAWLKIVQNNLA